MPVLLYRTKLRHTEKATYFTKMVKLLFHWYIFVLETSYTVKLFCVAKNEAFSHHVLVSHSEFFKKTEFNTGRFLSEVPCL